MNLQFPKSVFQEPLAGLKCHIRRAQAVAARKLLGRTLFAAVTGSSAKTTTCDLVAKVLAQKGPVMAFSGHNALHDIVVNLRRVPWNTAAVVQEVSGHTPGHVAEAARLLKPHIAVVTAVGTEHISNFGSIAGVAAEKGQLARSLPPDGLAVLNADDPLVLAMRGHTRAKVITYGFAEGADVRCLSASARFPARLSLTVQYEGRTYALRTKFVGSHWAASVLASLACGAGVGADLERCCADIASYVPRLGRLSVHETGSGPVFVYEHKAPAWSLDLFLDTVRNAEAARKTIVFGRISDIRRNQGLVYRDACRKAMSVAGRVIFIGPMGESIRKMPEEELAGKVLFFDGISEARDYFKSDGKPGDLIFLKGSATVDLPRIFLEW